MADPKTHLENIQKKLIANPGLSSINAVFIFKINGEGGGVWTLDLTQTPGAITDGETKPGNCTVILEAADFDAMINKTANPMQLYMTQKLKVEGNLPLSLKLQQIIG